MTLLVKSAETPPTQMSYKSSWSELPTLACMDDITITTTSALSGQSLTDWLPDETSESRVEHYQVMLAELKKAQKDIRAIRKLALEALSANEAFFGKRGKKKGDRKYKTKMDRIEKKLNN